MGLVILALFAMAVGQMSIMPTLAPLARAVDLPEWQIGLMMSVAAITIVLTSPWWGRRAQAIGSKPVVVLALIAGIVSTLGFAAAAGLGLDGVITGAVLFGLFVLTRGLLYGGAMGAVMTATQTYIANVTITEKARVKGMAMMGTAQGMAMIVGSAAGGILSLLGLLTPLIVVPIVLTIMLILISTRLHPELSREQAEKPVKVSPFDRRIFPFLVAGFGMFTALGFLQLVIGFLISDRYSFSKEQVASFTGGAMLCAGIGMIVAQGIIVPKSGWSPSRLLLVGTAIAAVGIALYAPDLGLVFLGGAALLAGLGIGIAMPGFTAGPTLVVEPAERGAVAGLISATMALSFMVAPALSTALYGIRPELPVIVAALTMVATFLMVLLSPAFRRADKSPTPAASESSA